ncbi:MAG TPA: Mrp/NBP35 family ATP-binding protein [Acidimicrobiales bacterium]|nr:Mrp/NBP35 family ATP-binding protein [Acidimicrobiales bacterium]
MAAEQSHVEAVVEAVVDPELGLPLGEACMVGGVRVKRHRATIALALPAAAWPDLAQLEEAVRAAVLGVPGVDEVAIEPVAMSDRQRAGLRAALRARMETVAAPGAGHAPGEGHGHGGHGHGEEPVVPAFLQPGSATRVIGVGSGKGGVGKSSVTVNLAVALAAAGHSVGVLDADVYGFSVPKMLGAERDPLVLGDVVVPTAAHGVRCLSMGFFVPDDQPVIWRGPMLHKAIQQFLSDAYWGEPDFLLVDMPPGTGDVTLSLAQVMPRAEMLVVTTPQAAAQRVAQRSAYAARKLKLAVRGVIENMSWFTGVDGVRYELFGSGGGQALARDLGVPLLGQVPLVPAVREGGDEGLPVVAADPAGEAASAFRAVADRLAALGPARVYRRELAVRPST